MENRVKFLLKNISFLTVGEFGTKIISFFLVPIYTYVLTTNEYGTADLIFTISTLLTPLIMLNIGEALMRYLLEENADRNKIMSVAITAFIFGILLALIIVPIVSNFTILSNYKWYMYFYIVLCSTKAILTGYLRGTCQLRHYAICNVLNTLLLAIFNIIFLVFFDLGIKGYLVAYIIAEICSILYVIIFGHLTCSIKKFKFDIKFSKGMILFSLAVVPNSLLWWVINSSDRLMVTSFLGLSSNGLLSISYKIPSLLIMLNFVLMQAWKYSAIKEKDSRDNVQFTNSAFDKFIRVSILLASFLILIIKYVVKWLFAPAYFNAWTASCFLLLGFVFMGISTFIGTVYYVKKDMIGNVLSALVGASINIILNFLLIPLIGFSGAALAATLSYLCILLYRYFDTRKYQKINLFNPKYMFLLGLTIIMIIGNLLNNLVGTAMLILSFILVLVFNISFLYHNFSIIFKIIRSLFSDKSLKE